MCVLFEQNGGRAFGGSEKPPRTIYVKIPTLVSLYSSDFMKIAGLNFSKEQRECFERISLPTRGGQLPYGGLVEPPVGFRFAAWADFLEFAYQPLFTPAEKDLWTKEVGLRVCSCRPVSTEGFMVPSPEKVKRTTTEVR